MFQRWDTLRIAKAWVPMSWRQWILNLPTNYRKVGMRINILWFVSIRLQRMISKLTVTRGRIMEDRFLWWGSKLCFYIKYQNISQYKLLKKIEKNLFYQFTDSKRSSRTTCYRMSRNDGFWCRIVDLRRRLKTYLKRQRIVYYNLVFYCG